MKLLSKYLTTPLGVASGLIVLVLSFMTVADIVVRFFTSRSIPGVIEYSEVLLVVCVFFAFGAAQNTRTHVATSVLTERLPRKARKVIITIAASISVVMLVALVVATTQEAWGSVVSGEYRFGLVQVPLWPAKVAVALGMGVYLIEFVRSYLLTSDVPLADDEQQTKNLY